MKVLFLYPPFPDTFWSLKYAIRFLFKKSAYPPLGLLTVASMLPSTWQVKLIDMNTQRLFDKHLKWANLVFISAMSLQFEAISKIVTRCKKAGAHIVAGGPLFTAWPEKFDDIDYLVLDEAEITLPLFIEDFHKGSAKHMYTSNDKPDLSLTPVPRWDLVNMKQYSSMNIQYSRGCPFDCEFCEITVLYGRIPRLKSAQQIVTELDSLYTHGWRGNVFFVDDNFIGNKKILKEQVLPAIIEWSHIHDRPFTFHTEASINMADDEELMDLMVKAGFDMVFIGIETPCQDSLAECGKRQNQNRDLISCIDRIQKKGLQVQGGFILGFDNDPESIFDMVTRFIQQSGIVVAMVGLLNAPRGTKLYNRLNTENRILSDMSGNNTDYSTNFETKMDFCKLTDGYKAVVNKIYAPDNYYSRIQAYLNKTNGIHKVRSQVDMAGIAAFIRSIFQLGIFGKERRCYWKLVWHTLLHTPSQISQAVSFAICGYHFRKIYKI